MQIAINSGYFRKIFDSDKTRTDLECARLCKKGGFSHIDCSPNFLKDSDWQDQAKKLAADLESEGIIVEQSHAPFNRYNREPESQFKEKLRRSFLTAAELGAKNIVIHADEYVCEKGTYDSEAACRFAYDYFAPFVELAQKNGIGVAVENLFEDGIHCKRDRCTSTTDEILRIIELFNTPEVSCCWDFGHAAVSFGDNMLDELKKVGGHVTCTHVHDNYKNSDTHLPIFLGKINWKAHMDYLRKILYKGAFTFEFVYGVIPENLIDDFLKFQYNAAQFIVGQKMS